MLTLTRALQVVQHAGYGSTGLPALDYINEAGRRLAMMRPWWWMQAPPINVGVRGPISLVNATWTEATLTLSLAGAFTGYAHAHGDIIEITAGTGSTLKRYIIAEKLNDNGVRLAETIGPNAADVRGTVEANAAAILPSNFGGQLNVYTTTNNLTSTLTLISQQELTGFRAGYDQPSAGHYVGALFVAENLTTAGGPPSYRIELYPKPTTAQAALFTLSYQIDWRPVEADTSHIGIPSWIDPLFLEILRAVTHGYEDEEGGNVADRINQIRSSSTYIDAVNHDSMMQPSFGVLRGGAEAAYAGNYSSFPDTPVPDM